VQVRRWKCRCNTCGDGSSCTELCSGNGRANVASYYNFKGGVADGASAPTASQIAWTIKELDDQYSIHVRERSIDINEQGIARMLRQRAFEKRGLGESLSYDDNDVPEGEYSIPSECDLMKFTQLQDIAFGVNLPVLHAKLLESTSGLSCRWKRGFRDEPAGALPECWSHCVQADRRATDRRSATFGRWEALELRSPRPNQLDEEWNLRGGMI